MNTQHKKIAMSALFFIYIGLMTSPLSAQDYLFIEHKPSGVKMHSCSTTHGTAVKAVSQSNNSDCAQWQRVFVGNYFHLKNRTSGKYIRPNTSQDSSSIVIQPNSWTGNWTQWSYDEREPGYGHLVNKATGKYIYYPRTEAGKNLQQQPSSWRGDFTRWRFTSVTTPTITPTPTQTPSVTSPPTPLATQTPRAPIKVEAETGATYGSAQTYSDNAASGEQGIAYLNEVGAGFSLTNIPKSNAIRITYASALSGEISYAINSTDMGNLSFVSTGNWTGSYGSAVAYVSIPENATLDIFYDAGDTAMNVDYIEFINGDLPTPAPTPSPTIPVSTPTPNETPGINLYSKGFNQMTVGSKWFHADSLIQAYTQGGPDEKIMRIRYVPTDLGSKRVVKNFKLSTPVTSATLSFDLKLHSQFEFVRGGKLHGLGGGTATTGCKPIDPNGWSVRMMWRPAGNPVLYLYHQDRVNRCGDDVETLTDFTFERGRWYRIAIYVKLNSAIASGDGVASLYIDGVKQAERTGLNLTGNMDEVIDKFLFSTFYGGSDSSWSPSKTTYIYYDNFEVVSGKKH